MTETTEQGETFGPLGTTTVKEPRRRAGNPKGSKHRSPAVKAAAVTMATIHGVPAAAEALGIPERTIAYWRDDPMLQELASRATEEIAMDAKVIAQEAMNQLRSKLPDASAWDLSRIATQMTQIEALRTGKPTAITQTKDTTDSDDSTLEELLAQAEEEQRRRASAPADAGDPPAPGPTVH